jgi:hypothetical protein
LKLRLEGEFLVNGMTVKGAAPVKLHRMFDTAPPDVLPGVAELRRKGSTGTRAALKRHCEWLLAHRLANGFLGDWGSYGMSREPQHYWYTAAYPIRTLLAGYDIFGDARFLEACTRILDRLVEEQMPNGAFQQVWRGKPTAQLTKAEIDDIVTHRWMNTADVGSIVTALAVAAHYADPARRARYIAAARRYCDDFARQWQQPNGGFTNGIVAGRAETNIYSVATGTQAAQFAALYAVTRDPKYLEVAERAAGFLADNVVEDGQLNAYAWSPGKPVVPYLQPLSFLGEIYYHHDGMMFVYHQSKNEAFRARLHRDVMGARGLMSHLPKGSVWWPLQDAWNNSKSAAMPLPLMTYQEMGGNPRVAAFLDLARRFLCTHEYSASIGVMLEDPDLPWAGHTLQSWTGCTVAATGFGGMSLAEWTKPGVIYLTAR